LGKVGSLFLCLIFALCLIIPVRAPFETFTVSAGQIVTRKVELERLETAAGTVRASGGNNTINFYVTDPNGNIILYHGRMSQISFSFVASISGTHTLHFDNSYSTAIKGVTLNYSIEPPIFGLPQGLFYTILRVIIIVIIVFIVLIIVVPIILKRRRLKTSKGA